MCGRAYVTYSKEELEKRFSVKCFLNFDANYNFAPTGELPIIFIKNGERHVEMMRWGLIPSWAKDIESASKYSLINARIEDIEQKPSYRQAFKKRRCIVPFSGFYEWLSSAQSPKRPFAISLKDEIILSVAGIYEEWISQEGEIIYSFSVITTSSNPFMAKIHDRMPMILQKDKEEEWLNPKNENVSYLKSLLIPCPPDKLEAYEVSRLVNSPKNNSPEILDPV